MDELLRTYMRYCGKNSEDQWPDSCNVNLYEDGSHAVGWHADDEALFQGLERDVSIVSLHFGEHFKEATGGEVLGPASEVRLEEKLARGAPDLPSHLQFTVTPGG